MRYCCKICKRLVDEREVILVVNDSIIYLCYDCYIESESK